MTTALKVRAIRHYGRLTVYPECQTSKNLCDLLGQKTLTELNVRKLKSMGFTFEVQTPEVEL